MKRPANAPAFASCEHRSGLPHLQPIRTGSPRCQSDSGGCRRSHPPWSPHRPTVEKRTVDWVRILQIVMAEDRAGHSLHPTLRALWDAVDASSHVVYIEMRARKESFIAGRFAITRVDPSGKAHEAILILNPPLIDELSAGPGAARGDGFIPFEGLGKYERYAELLGHELAHAVWTFADPERGRLVMPLQAENEHVMRRLLDNTPRSGDRERVSELVRLSEMLEEPAEAAEVAVWKELRAGQRCR
jgi:hypothetical protein